MDKLFVDTDIILDLLSKREPFYIHAARLFSLADKRKIKLFISSLCFNNLNYILSKQYNQASVRKTLTSFKALVHVLSVDDKIIELALNSEFNDFEDAIQYYVALENKVPVLVTRNLKDYKKATIPVMTAEIYLKNLGVITK